MCRDNPFFFWNLGVKALYINVFSRDVLRRIEDCFSGPADPGFWTVRPERFYIVTRIEIVCVVTIIYLNLISSRF